MSGSLFLNWRWNRRAEGFGIGGSRVLAGVKGLWRASVIFYIVFIFFIFFTFISMN